MIPLLTSAIQVAGLVQLGMAALAMLIPRILRFKQRLAVLDSALRTLMRVYSVFIALVIAGMGGVSLAHAEELARGTPLARSVCGFMAIFWTARLGVQLFAYDSRSIAPTPILRAGYHALTVCFVFLSATFLATAITGVLSP